MNDSATERQEVKVELSDLETKIENLSNFIKNGRPKGIKRKQYSLLKKQLKVMRKYAQILHNRVLVW